MVDTGELVSEIRRLAAGLDGLSYYEFLALRPAADYVAVRDAFYARAQHFHPDRFVASDDQALRSEVYAVYKRMTEAYNVLLDPQLRVAYDAARVRGEVRLSEVARSRRLTSDERAVSNPFARIYLTSAKAKIERGEIVAAYIDLLLGLSLERAKPLLELIKTLETEPASAAILAGVQ